MLLVIDNYDSFTYNLVQYFGELGAVVEVRRNDEVTLDDIARLKPERICISPGPCTPTEAGISCAVVERFSPRLPLLGVCLGHQGIGEAFGGRVVRAGRLMHGKTTEVTHLGTDLFEGVANPLTVMRYHSLVVSPTDFPAELEITAWSMDRPRAQEIMALRHRTHPIFGVQFHPESIATESGKALLQNFLRLAAEFRASRSEAVA